MPVICLVMNFLSCMNYPMKKKFLILGLVLLCHVTYAQRLPEKLTSRLEVIKAFATAEVFIYPGDTTPVYLMPADTIKGLCLRNGVEAPEKPSRGRQNDCAEVTFLESFWNEDEKVPWFGLFLFSEFRNPIQADTLDRERIFSEWNQFMLCDGYPLVPKAACTRKEAEDSLVRFLSKADSRYEFGPLFCGLRCDVSAFRSWVCRFMEPDAIFNPFFIYGVGFEMEGKVQSLGMTGYSEVWFLRNDSIYTGIGLDAEGKLKLFSLDEELAQVDTAFARWLNSRTSESSVPLDIRRKSVIEICNEHLPLQWFLGYPFYKPYKKGEKTRPRRSKSQAKSYNLWNCNNGLPKKGEELFFKCF